MRKDNPFRDEASAGVKIRVVKKSAGPFKTARLEIRLFASDANLDFDDLIEHEFVESYDVMFQRKLTDELSELLKSPVSGVEVQVASLPERERTSQDPDLRCGTIKELKIDVKIPKDVYKDLNRVTHGHIERAGALFLQKAFLKGLQEIDEQFMDWHEFYHGLLKKYGHLLDVDRKVNELLRSLSTVE